MHCFLLRNYLKKFSAILARKGSNRVQKLVKHNFRFFGELCKNMETGYSGKNNTKVITTYTVKVT